MIILKMVILKLQSLYKKDKTSGNCPTPIFQLFGIYCKISQDTHQNPFSKITCEVLRKVNPSTKFSIRCILCTDRGRKAL